MREAGEDVAAATKLANDAVDGITKEVLREYRESFAYRLEERKGYAPNLLLFFNHTAQLKQGDAARALLVDSTADFLEVPLGRGKVIQVQTMRVAPQRPSNVALVVVNNLHHDQFWKGAGPAILQAVGCSEDSVAAEWAGEVVGRPGTRKQGTLVMHVRAPAGDPGLAKLPRLLALGEYGDAWVKVVPAAGGKHQQVRQERVPQQQEPPLPPSPPLQRQRQGAQQRHGQQHGQQQQPRR